MNPRNSQLMAFVASTLLNHTASLAQRQQNTSCIGYFNQIPSKHVLPFILSPFLQLSSELIFGAIVDVISIVSL